MGDSKFINEVSPEEEQKRRELHKRGYSDTEAAQVLGMSYGGYYCWRNSRGLPQNKVKKYRRREKLKEMGLTREEFAKRVKDAYKESGLSQKEFTYELGVTWAAVYYWMVGKTIPHDPEFVLEMLDLIEKKYGGVVTCY